MHFNQGHIGMLAIRYSLTLIFKIYLKYFPILLQSNPKPNKSLENKMSNDSALVDHGYEFPKITPV